MLSSKALRLGGVRRNNSLFSLWAKHVANIGPFLLIAGYFASAGRAAVTDNWNQSESSHKSIKPRAVLRHTPGLRLWNSGWEEFVGASTLEAHGANTKRARTQRLRLNWQDNCLRVIRLCLCGVTTHMPLPAFTWHVHFFTDQEDYAHKEITVTLTMVPPTNLDLYVRYCKGAIQHQPYSSYDLTHLCNIRFRQNVKDYCVSYLNKTQS